MKNKITFFLCFVAFTTSAQYQINSLVTGLNNPIAFTLTPDGRIFITQKNGLVNAYDSTGFFIQTVYDLSDSTFNYGECGLLGICLDPQFPVNHYFYIYYNHYDSAAISPQTRIRILRLTEFNNSAGSPLLLLDIPQLGNNHLGGNLHFNNTSLDKLYITIGENTIQPNAQLTNNPYGKILRINSDGSIPTDNPFYDDGDPLIGNDDRIWAYGLRNSFDFTFSPLTDSLYATENGPSQDDEVNIIHKGSNYGWPTYTGYVNNPLFTDPIYTWTPTVAPTGVLFYSDTVFPQFNNHLLVSIFNNGYIIDLTLGNAPFYDTVTGFTIPFNFGTGFANFLTSLNKGNDGCIYALHGGNTGILYQICPQPAGIFSPEANLDKILQVYPLPASESVVIKWKKNSFKKIKLNLFDVYGRLCRSSGEIEIDEDYTFNVNTVLAGIYYLKIEARERTNETVTYYEKITVEH